MCTPTITALPHYVSSVGKFNLIPGTTSKNLESGQAYTPTTINISASSDNNINTGFTSSICSANIPTSSGTMT
jgi:hypothetical protein